MSAAVDIDRETRERAKFLVWATETFPRFCGLLDIIDKDGVRRKLTLNPIQKEFSRNRSGFDVALKARQVGFTTIELARDIWWFVKVPGARVVVTCQSDVEHKAQKGISAAYRIMLEGLQRSGLALNFRTESSTEWVLLDRDSSLKIMEAGATKQAAQKKGRSGTINRLHCTETAFYEYAEDTLNSLLECVPTRISGNSEIVHESTPNGADGVFYRLCKQAELGRNGYEFHFFPWFRTAEYRIALEPGERVEPETERERRLFELGVTPEQLKWYRQKVAGKGENEKGGQDWVDQEYPTDPETCFLSSGRKFFDMAVTKELIEKATGEPIEKRDRDRIRIWKPADKRRSYLLSVDTSEGAGADPSGALMYDYETGEHVVTMDGFYSTGDLARACAKLGREYSHALIVVERNNHGHAVLQGLTEGLNDPELEPFEQVYPNVYVHEDDKFGWPTGPVTRPVMLDGLEDAFRKGAWTSPDRIVLGQFKTFVVTKSGKSEHAQGEHDELVIAAAIGWKVRERPKFDGKLGIAGAETGWMR